MEWPGWRSLKTDIFGGNREMESHFRTCLRFIWLCLNNSMCSLPALQFQLSYAVPESVFLKSITGQESLNLTLFVEHGDPVLPGYHGQIEPLLHVRTLF